MTGVRKHGKLIVIRGSMFSGKTSRLMEALERENIAGRETILFKPKIDNRYDEIDVVSHKGIRMSAFSIDTDRRGSQFIEEKSRGYKVVGVDEGQFFETGAELPQLLNRLAFEGKSVYVSILEKDHMGKPFQNTGELLALADDIISLNAICLKCGAEGAAFSQRVIDGKEVFGPQLQVGGKESYEPRCRACYVRPDSDQRILV